MALPMLRRAVRDFNLRKRGGLDKQVGNLARKGVAAAQAEAGLRRRIRNAEKAFMRLSGG